MASDDSVSSERGEGEVGVKVVKEVGKGYEMLNAPNVVPEAFENEWEDRMNAWGGMMKDA